MGMVDRVHVSEVKCIQDFGGKTGKETNGQTWMFTCLCEVRRWED